MSTPDRLGSRRYQRTVEGMLAPQQGISRLQVGSEIQITTPLKHLDEPFCCGVLIPGGVGQPSWAQLVIQSTRPGFIVLVDKVIVSADLTTGINFTYLTTGVSLGTAFDTHNKSRVISAAPRAPRTNFSYDNTGAQPGTSLFSGYLSNPGAGPNVYEGRSEDEPLFKFGTGSSLIVGCATSNVSAGITMFYREREVRTVEE